MRSPKGRTRVSIGDVTVAPLVKGAATRESKTLAAANQDYAFVGNIPAGTKLVELYSASACLVAVGEATSAVLGRTLPADVPTIYPVSSADVTDGSALHAQSAVAGAVIYATYLPA